jgi:hypothetical protein
MNGGLEKCKFCVRTDYVAVEPFFECSYSNQPLR